VESRADMRTPLWVPYSKMDQGCSELNEGVLRADLQLLRTELELLRTELPLLRVELELLSSELSRVLEELPGARCRMSDPRALLRRSAAQRPGASSAHGRLLPCTASEL